MRLLRPRVRRSQDPRRGQVDHHAGQGDPQNHPAVHRRWRDEAQDGVVDDDQRQDEERDAVGLGAQDLRPAQPEGQRAARGPGGQARRHEGDGQSGGIGEHVRRVGEQSQGGGERPGHDLRDHEAADQDERPGQGPAIGVAVVVALPVGHQLSEGSIGIRATSA